MKEQGWWARSVLAAQTSSGQTSDGGWQTPAGLSVHSTLELLPAPAGLGQQEGDRDAIRLHVELARLRLLRGFEELLCLDGLNGVEHLPHQVDTVRRVLRHFRGRVLLADEVGLGKTIEACLLLREYLLRGMVRRVLILTPAALVRQWQDELAGKFGLQFQCVSAGSATTFWAGNDRVLSSLPLAKSRKHFDAVVAAPWDLVIVDEAHHCKNRNTRNWQLVNSIKRRYLFLLSATPVQNNLVELYNLLTLLEPGHLKTETDFKRMYVTRGNPRDPRNRERLRGLLGEVMIRNTRSLVSIDLPPRYAQTFVVSPGAAEKSLYDNLQTYLRWRCQGLRGGPTPAAADGTEGDEAEDVLAYLDADGAHPGGPSTWAVESDPATLSADQPCNLPVPSQMQVNSLLMAAGSHPSALVPALSRFAEEDGRAAVLEQGARGIQHSAKQAKLVELLRENRAGKTIVFANFRATIRHLDALLDREGIAHAVFSGEQSAEEKAKAVTEFRDAVPVLICSDSGGEGQNLQFANTLINFDLPWNPMRIEQRIGRVHRIGQTREVFVFNLCTAGSLEERILGVLNDKIRMFELVVGEVGSILGNLDGGDGFESLVLDLWMKSANARELDAAFAQFGESLVAAQEQYLETKELDEALFGDEYE